MNGSRSIAIPGFIFVSTLVFLFGYGDGQRQFAPLDVAQLEHSRGLDQTKTIAATYSCAESMANFNNQQNNGSWVADDDCPANANAPITNCIQCDPPGTDFTLVLNTHHNGQKTPPGYYANASVSCGPMSVGICGFDANGNPVCEDPMPNNSNCNDITEFYVQPPPKG